MRKFNIEERVRKKLTKLSKKHKNSYLAVMQKIREIINSDYIKHYKHLRYNMKDSQRVHISSFVLVFSYDKEKDFISFEDFDHHDNIYKK